MLIQEKTWHITSLLPPALAFTEASAIVCDNASNNDTFMSELQKRTCSSRQFVNFNAEQSRQRCIPHIVNLVCQAFLKRLFGGKDEIDKPVEQPVELEDDESDSGVDVDDDALDLPVMGDAEINFDGIQGKNPLKKLQKLIKKINGSTQMLEKFEHTCKGLGVPILSATIDVCTHWNSTFDMSFHACQLKRALNEICTTVKSFASYKLTSNEWKYLEAVTEVLKPLKQITCLFSMDQYPTLGQVILYFNQLIDHFENV